ncbi:MAG: glycosyltransferase [Flavobacteriaceae bacterium]|nr:glycosyltransferase [Flavobacteriaceae bacterium]
MDPESLAIRETTKKHIETTTTIESTATIATTETNTIRVLQLIDSLDAGGGERMAVNLANSLIGKVEVSGLACTRKEGVLKSLIQPNINYLFCDKKGVIDVKAISKTITFIKKHKITHIHAHGSSYFFAFLLKLKIWRLKIIWHDHHGNRVNETKSLNSTVLKFVSRHFFHIFCVSTELVNWAKNNLQAKSVSNINNFVFIDNQPKALENFKISSPFIVCVANLREPKNHLNLVEAFKIIKNQSKNKSWKLVLVGDDKKDEYSKFLKNKITESKLGEDVFILGQRSDVGTIVDLSSIAVLSSKVEALPMALIEYASFKKPVVVTDVGQCAEVVGKFGKVVPPNNSKALAEALLFYVNKPEVAKQDALNLHQKVTTEFNPETITQQVIEVYTS